MHTKHVLTSGLLVACLWFLAWCSDRTFTVLRVSVHLDVVRSVASEVERARAHSGRNIAAALTIARSVRVATARLLRR